MSSVPSFVPLLADWQSSRHAIAGVRTAVFVREQGIPAALEWDGQDPACSHVLVVDDCGNAIGTGRLQPDGRIGRMAVLPGWRRRGIGSAILLRLSERAAELGMQELYLHAQLASVDFYRDAGFCQQGSVFEEAGIPHLCMIRRAG